MRAGPPCCVSRPLYSFPLWQHCISWSVSIISLKAVCRQEWGVKHVWPHCQCTCAKWLSCLSHTHTHTHTHTHISVLCMLPRWLSVENSPANAGDSGSIPGSGRSPAEGNGNPLQYSCLGNRMDRGNLVGNSPWGCKRVRHDLVTKQQLIHGCKLSEKVSSSLIL